jgi:dipeptidase
MNLRKLFSVFGSLFVALVFLSAIVFMAPEGKQEKTNPSESQERGCTSILVGKDASTDGSTITTHTCDCGMCDWTWRHVPAADHEPGTMRKIYHVSQYQTWPPNEGLKWDKYKEAFSGVEIPQVLHTCAYHHGMFGYMNEYQLALGESTIGCRRRMRNPTPSATFDITALTRIAMERCKTAREAIKLMGSLAEKHGYGFHDGGEMLAVADPNEAWIFEIMPVGPLWTPESGKPGAVWCAQRVPDDHVSVCPNESRIGKIDLDNPDYFLASSNAISFAVENGYYDPESGEPFSWKKAYSSREGSATSSGGTRARLWRFFDLVAPSRTFSPETPNVEFPFSVKPDKKISVEDVINMTRDKHQGNPFDPARGILGGPFSNPNYFQSFKLDDNDYSKPRCICVNNVEYTTVTQSRDWLPNPIGGIVWLSFGAQDTSCYMPLYAGISEIPESFKIGDHWEFNRKSARWAFDTVDFHTQVMYSYAIEDVKEAQTKYEDSVLAKTPAIDKAAHELYRQDPAQAVIFLTDYCISNADKVVDAWWELGDYLLIKYNHFRIYDTVKRKAGRIKHTELWNRAVVEHEKLKPLEPREKK